MAAQRPRHVPGHLSSRSSPDSSLSTTPNHLRTPQNESSNTADNCPVPAAPLPSGGTLYSKPLEHTEAEDPSLQQTDETSKPQLYSTSTSVSISNQTSAHIILPTSSSHAATPCALTKLDKCVVDMTVPTTNGAPFAGLTIRNISSSLLLCGRIDGPAHITSIQNSVMVIKCRQFRMHECNNVDVYLTCFSRPIIEDCSEIRFTRLPSTYVS